MEDVILSQSQKSTTVHTVEVITAEPIDNMDEYPWFTGELRKDRRTELNKTRVNPAYTGVKIKDPESTKEAIDTAMQTIGVSDYRLNRIDYAIDEYHLTYNQLFKIGSLIITLVGDRLGIANSFKSFDSKNQAKKLTVRVQNNRYQAEFYNKAVESPDSLIKARFEFRSLNLKDRNRPDMISHNLLRWLRVLEESTAKKAYSHLQAEINDIIVAEYKQNQQKYGSITELITVYADNIYCTAQLVDLYTKFGYSEQVARNKATAYKASHEFEDIRHTRLKEFVKQMKKSAQKYLKNN